MSRTDENSFSRSEVLHDLAHLTELRARATGRKADPAAAKLYKAAVQRFAEQHQGLAFEMAKRYSRHNINQNDLRQTAMLGLLEAVQRWQPAKAQNGATFATFAAYRIRHELQELIRKQLPLVRCSELVHKDQHKIRKVRRAAAGRELGAPELAKATGLSARRVQAALETDTRELGYKNLAARGALPGQVLDAATFEEQHLVALDVRTGRVEATFDQVASELRPRRRARLAPPRKPAAPGPLVVPSLG